MNNFKLLLLAAFFSLFIGAFLVTSPLAADESDSIYGRGVHSYFDRKYDEAVKILSEADHLNSVDPRPYYFLGLAYLQQKQTEKADESFKKAAQLEFGGRAARDYAVSESLRRIQGIERQRIEKIRAEERTKAQKQAQRLQKIRYGEKNASGRNILRETLPKTQKEDLAMLQRITASFGGNTFGAKPIDPTATSEEIIAVQRTENNPFGGIKTNEDTLPEIVAIKPVDRNKIAVLSTDEGEQPTTPVAGAASPIRQAQAAAAKELGKGLRSLFENINKVQPKIVTFEPDNGAEAVDTQTVKEIRITFDVDMNAESFGVISSAGTTQLKLSGEPSWADTKTCVFPVALEPGQSYNLLIVRPPQGSGFQSNEGVPAANVTYKFSTQ